MDSLKTESLECIERSWKAPDKFVCPDCVGDVHLKGEIVRNLTKRKCGYCGKGSRKHIAAPVSAIMKPIATALFRRFVDWHSAGSDECNLDELPTTMDALREIPLECHEALFKDVAAAFWCDKWVNEERGFNAPDISMNISWGKFVQTVKHRERFFFSSVKRKNRREFYFVKPPAELLDKIGQMVSELKLIKPLKAGTDLFRVRSWPKDEDWCLDDIEKNLGAPPDKKCFGSQRMNPAGISYLYLAMERATAIAEGLSKPPCQAALGCSQVRRDLCVLDLVNLPEMPSPFDNERHREGESITFLRYFAEEISKPVQKDGTEHIEYVPSQVVCEYFATMFQTDEEKPIDGLSYPSAIRPGGINIVLFPPPRRGECFSDLVNYSSAEEIEFQNWFEFFDAIQASGA